MTTAEAARLLLGWDELLLLTHVRRNLIVDSHGSHKDNTA